MTLRLMDSAFDHPQVRGPGQIRAGRTAEMVKQYEGSMWQISHDSKRPGFGLPLFEKARFRGFGLP